MTNPFEILGFVQWASTTLLEMEKGGQDRARQCRERVANYFDVLAETLIGIESNLRKGIVPRVLGHRLRGLIDCFEATMTTNFLGKTKWPQQAVHYAGLREMLRITLEADKRLDDEGDLNPPPESEMKGWLEDLERAAGRFSATAVMIRSIGPARYSGSFN